MDIDWITTDRRSAIREAHKQCWRSDGNGTRTRSAHLVISSISPRTSASFLVHVVNNAAATPQLRRNGEQRAASRIAPTPLINYHYHYHYHYRAQRKCEMRAQAGARQQAHSPCICDGGRGREAPIDPDLLIKSRLSLSNANAT